MQKIVTMGGGTGHSQVLKALKGVPEIVITGICPSTDSGGSTGVLRKEYDGNGYTGDLTKCVTALCDNEILSKALSYRYDSGPLHSHSVKNLLFHALEKVSTIEEALETFWKICGLGPHRVLPVTNEKTELCVSLEIGDTISGEANIDTLAKNPLWNPLIHSISDVYLKPKVKASKLAIDAVARADYLIVCPGDLYSSVIPTLLPGGMQGAIRSSQAKIVLILNIMTKKGETDNYTATDFIEKIEKYLGRPATHIIANNAPIPENVLLQYSLEQKIEFDTQRNTSDLRILSTPLAEVSEEGHVLTSPQKLRGAIEQILRP
jgi:uncharacterized cofD-like protein